MPYSTLSRHASSLGLWAAAGLAGMLAFAPRASAADLDPGYADVPPPMTQQQLQFGSGWYVRGDIAATDDRYHIGAQRTAPSTAVPVVSSSKDFGYDLSLGGGYAFTNSIRGDLTVDFLQPDGAHGTNQDRFGTYLYSASLNRYVALANGYYDIGTWSIVTPYVGAGAGVAFGSGRVSGNSLPTQRAFGPTRTTYYRFAWAVMAGVAFDIYNHVKLDIGYRYLHAGDVFGAKLDNHEARAGIRYMIDN